MNVNEEVLTADFKMAESITFSKKGAGRDSGRVLTESLGTLSIGGASKVSGEPVRDASLDYCGMNWSGRESARYHRRK